MQSQIVVCGAGPVGLTAALKFAQAGLEVTVIEADNAIKDFPRAIAYFASVQEGLESLDPSILEELRSLAHPNQGMCFYSPGTNFRVDIEPVPPEAGPYATLLHLGQEQVGAMILKRLAAFPSARVRWGTRLTDMTIKDDSVRLQVETEGGHETIDCDWLVGADGANSTVRKLAGIEFEGHTWSNRLFASNVTYDFTKSGFRDVTHRWDPDSYALIARINPKGVWRLAFGESATLPLETALERATARLSQFIPEGENYEVLRLQPYKIHQRAGTTLRQGRVLLAGDAAHATNPMGGLGLTGGLWDAFILGDVLPAVIKREAADDALDQYSKARLKVFWDVTSATATTNLERMRERDPEKRQQNRELIQKVLGTPSGLMAFASLSHRIIGDPVLPDSPWQKYQ